MQYRYYLIFTLLTTTFSAAGQNVVKGRVNNFTYDTLSFLANASVTNTTRNASVLTDQYGYYSIPANENDRIVYSHTGFISDTVIVQSQFFISGYDAALIEEAAFLAGVTVMSEYRRDSIRRRQQYAFAYEKPPGITGGNTPQAGVGIVLSPFSFFFPKTKRNAAVEEKITKAGRRSVYRLCFRAGMGKLFNRT
ncbi:hypothetical protein [Niabella ginsengisoli]|uniref:Carboxypeptidase-like regulatory domain-containing protein n=1 Tax=Niabella ginsengisoli TaxID=522298 RepID=A0ABS9SFC8_9BACT|nr:hypothetical protein [Niabella ginsengisoli]MCH5597050.1 hypothetical protein [Niabella ginsengisoli]